MICINSFYNQIMKITFLAESHLKPKVTFSLYPQLIYSESSNGAVDGTVKEHKRLARKENIFKSENKAENIQINIDDESSEVPETETEEDGDTTTDAYDTIADEDSEDSKDEASETEEDKSEAESHYKSIKCQDDDYSYAYKDCLSPAALIKMENESVVSEVSEVVYESLRNVPRTVEKDNMSTMSESVSEREDFFFSISKGRRNYLKLHKYVDWELNSVTEEKEKQQAPANSLPVSNKISFKPIPEKGSIGDHSRLLPLLLEEEVSNYYAQEVKIKS